MRDWDAIKRTYVDEGESLRGLATRFEVPYSTVRSRARRERWDAERRQKADESLRREEFIRVGRKLLARIESCLDEGKEIDLKELKTVTGALKELWAMQEESGGTGGGETLTVRFIGEAEEMSR